MKHFFFFLLCLLSAKLFAQPGTLDPTFAQAGKAFPDLSASGDAAYQVVTLPDGSVLLGGGTKYNYRWEFAIVKRLPDGSPDISFAADPQDWIRNPGLAHYGTYPYDLYLYDMALLPSGRILAVGTASQKNTDGSTNDFAHAEIFEPNGERVSNWSFADFPAISTSRLGFATIVQPDGKFIVGAIDRSAGKMDIGRFLANGLRDLSFGANGATSLPISGWWSAYGVRLALMPDGKILASTSSGVSANGNILLARLMPNGQLDATFGTSGIATLDVGDNTDVPAGIHPLPDGKIFVTGWAVFDGGGFTSDALLMRLLSDGTPDPDFGTAGHRIHAISAQQDYPQRSMLLSDGKIVLTGFELIVSDNPAIQRVFAARFLPNGDLDPGFADDGVHCIDHPNNTLVYGLALMPNGGTVLGGFSISSFSVDDYLHE